MTESYIGAIINSDSQPSTRELLPELRRMMADLYSRDPRDYELLLTIIDEDGKTPTLTAGRGPLSIAVIVKGKGCIQWKFRGEGVLTMAALGSDQEMIVHSGDAHEGTFADVSGTVLVGVEP